jgi:hypothetical protein
MFERKTSKHLLVCVLLVLISALLFTVLGLAVPGIYDDLIQFVFRLVSL